MFELVECDRCNEMVELHCGEEMYKTPTNNFVCECCHDEEVYGE